MLSFRLAMALENKGGSAGFPTDSGFGLRLNFSLTGVVFCSGCGIASDCAGLPDTIAEVLAVFKGVFGGFNADSFNVIGGVGLAGMTTFVGCYIKP